MDRKSLSPKQRTEIFTARGGVCYLCGGKINGAKEAWDIEHWEAHYWRGNNELENLWPVHTKCHKVKTKIDKKEIAKSKRISAKYRGFSKSKRPMPGSRASKWKIKMNKTVEER